MGTFQRVVFGLLVSLLMNCPDPMAGQTLSFFRTTPGMGRAAAVAANASGIYVIGNGVRKYDSRGNELWTRAFSGPGPAFGVAADAASVYILGSGGPQLLLRKYSAGGNELWTRPLQQELTTVAVAADTSGVYVAVRDGYRHSLRKYSSDGSESWTRQWDAPSQGIFLAAAVDATGVYVLSFGVVGSGAGVLARKWESRGNELWHREYPTGLPTAIAAADPGGFYVASGTGFGVVSPFLRRYDTGGNELWSRQLATPPPIGLAADATGVYIVGATSPSGPALPGQCRSGSGGDAFVRKYDLNGAELWTREFGATGGTSASGVALDTSGVYVVGQAGTAPGAALGLDAFPDAGGAFLAKLEAAAAVVTGAGPRIFPDCVVNAASYVGGGVAPGEIVTFSDRGWVPRTRSRCA